MESSVIFIGYHRDLCFHWCATETYVFPPNPFVLNTPTQREPPLMTRFLLRVLLLLGGHELPVAHHRSS